MDINLYFSFIIASTIVLVIPGPTIITVISQSVNHGRKSAFPLILGVFLGDFSAMSLSLLGLGAILQTSAALFRIFKLAGALYLVCFGLKTFFGKEIQNKEENKEERHNGVQLFQSTFLVTILNPKSIAFFIAFFPQFIDPDRILMNQFFILGSTFLILAVTNATLYSIFAGKLGHLMKKSGMKKWFKRISGSVLIAAGVVTAVIKEH